MKDLLLTLLHWAVMTATLCGPGGVRAVIAEHLLLKQQLIVLRRPRQRAPRLTASDRLLFGFGALFLSPGRIRKVAIGVRPSTLLALPRRAGLRGSRRPARVAAVASHASTAGLGMQWLLAQHRDLLEAEFALNEGGNLLVRGDDLLCVSKSPCSRCIQE